jgi:osmoprotectant transport system substrate-binding protein
MDFIYSESGISIGAKNFTESKIIGEIYAQAIENAGYKVNKKFNLGGTLIAHESLKKGEIDLYPEYTGTAFINVLHHKPVYGNKKVFHTISQEYKSKWNLIWLIPAQANNSQGLVVNEKIAEKYNLYKISTLPKVSKNLRMISISEFEERDDGLKGLNKTYGKLNFKSINMYDSGIKYEVLLKNKADITICGTTDARLIDKRFVLLIDDKNFWPPYNVAPVIRKEILMKYPKLQNILNNISKKLTSDILQKLNADVDINKQTYGEVAKEFLIKEGLIKVKNE